MRKRGTDKRRRPIPILSVILAGLLTGICLGIALHINRPVRDFYPPAAATTEQISPAAP